MAILTATDLGKYYGAQNVLAGVSLEINPGDKIALIGPNGVGKTTLLRILCGLEPPTAGSVSRAKALRIGYLTQESPFTSQQTLYAEMLSLFANLQAQRARLREMEQRMSTAAATPDLLAQYGKAVEHFELAGGYEYEHRIQRVLNGLGFSREDFDKPMEILSGGQKTRAQLARLLLEEPDLLLLDEPTNHLDLAATEWLEKYLQSWPGSILVVSHDRYFLDKVVNRVAELVPGAPGAGARLEHYRGHYTHYAQQKAERTARQWKEYQQQQEKITKTEDFIRRYKSGQRSKEARGRQTRLKRLERIERPREQKTMHLTLQAHFRSSNDVLVSRGVTIGYPGLHGGEPNPLFRAGRLLLQRKQRVALLGPNGSGKTTFLKTILGQIEPLEGSLRLGPSVRVGYLAQSYEDLHPTNTILQEILSIKEMPLSQARHFAGRFLFSGDDVFKPISTLSGGEQGRVALAKLTLQGANFLLLDEPTNHLDIASQEILEQVLRDFEGAILFVSHDRYLIDRLATHLWVIEDRTLQTYEGNYTLYAALREQKAAEQAAAKEVARVIETDRRRSAADRRQPEKAHKRRDQAQITSQLEADIVALEERLRSLETALTEASLAQAVERIRELGQAHAAAEQELRQKLAAWAEISHD